MQDILQVDSLETCYGRSQVLFGIDLNVGRGEVVALMGRNGMGKTTTLRSIMGLTPARKGRVRINGVDYCGEPTFRIARAGLAIIPEGRQVFRRLTVREHLLMASGGAARSGPWSVDKVHELFPRLAERSGHLGGQLSGGEQQMLAIGRALMTNPDLILFDEATEGLAPLIRQEIWGAARKLKDAGCAIVIVDKNVADVANVADRMILLEKGAIVWRGTSAQLRDDSTLQRRYLGV